MKKLPFVRRPVFARRILDIGAGHNPYQGATHLLDMHLEDGTERGGRKMFVPDSAAIVSGNAEALPFVSASFDFVYASHVLEHVDDPARACREIMRVGTAGYIETPSPFLEQGLALADVTPEFWFHKWFVFSPRKNVLVFEPRNPEESKKFCSCPDGQFIREFFDAVDFNQAQHCFRRKAKTTLLHWKSSFLTEVRSRAADCRQDGKPCRFQGMRVGLLESCNDCFRILRMRRFRKAFPLCRTLFRRYGHQTLFVR